MPYGIIALPHAAGFRSAAGRGRLSWSAERRAWAGATVIDNGRLSVAHGAWEVEFASAVGGAVSRLTWRGRDVLRPMPKTSQDVLDAGCFPMVPFANRIADARFRFRGREVVLPAMPRFSPHTLHGDGWQGPWTVVEGRAALELAFVHEAGAWPWRYESRQTLAFVGERVRLSLSLTNRSDSDMPAGLGLHPYFPVDAETRLTLKAPSAWALAEHGAPTRLLPAGEVFDWSAGARLADGPALDHCYAGWGGSARLSDEQRTVSVSASTNADWAHVFAPPGEGYCCIEPVTHRPDALNAPPGERSGLAVLAPGEALSMWMEIGVEEIAD